MFGSPETTPGGRALKFYSSVRLDVRKIENLKDGTDVVGSRTRVKVVKNKVAPPFRQCEFDIMYGKGISKEGSLLDVGVDLEMIKKSGAWFTYEGEQLGQGKENARAFLAEHIDVRDEIETKVRMAVGLIGFTEEDDQPIQIDPDLVDLAEPRSRQGRQEGRVGGARRPRDPREAEGRPRAGARLLAVRQRSRRSSSAARQAARADAVVGELDRLEQVGLLDDEAFARAVVESRMGYRGESRRVVAGKLAQAGVAGDVAMAALDTAPEAEEERAQRLAEAKASRLRGLEPNVAFQRLYGFLARRGYGSEVARQAARKALAVETVEE
jgi:SOS response regulatory protein OraA/RecX